MINGMIKQWTDNNIGAEGAKKISELLMINTTLTQLDLWSDENKANEGQMKNAKKIRHDKWNDTIMNR